MDNAQAKTLGNGSKTVTKRIPSVGKTNRSRQINSNGSNLIRFRRDNSHNYNYIVDRIKAIKNNDTLYTEAKQLHNQFKGNIGNYHDIITANFTTYTNDVSERMAFEEYAALWFYADGSYYETVNNYMRFGTVSNNISFNTFGNTQLFPISSKDIEKIAALILNGINVGKIYNKKKEPRLEPLWTWWSDEYVLGRKSS